MLSVALIARLPNLTTGVPTVLKSISDLATTVLPTSIFREELYKWECAGMIPAPSASSIVLVLLLELIFNHSTNQQLMLTSEPEI